MNNELLISLLSFAAIVLLGAGIYLYTLTRRERKDVIKRIEQVGGEIREPGDEGQILNASKNFMLKILGSLGNLLKPKKEGELSLLRSMFLQAGIRKESAPVIFFGFKVFLALLFFAVCLLAKALVWPTMLPLHFMFITVLLVLLGFILPNVWIRRRIAGRKRKIQEGLPDALDMLVVCVEAGTGLDSAITRVGEEMKFRNKVLSEEFRLLSLELRAGLQRKDALRNLSLRTDLEDVSNLVTLLIQTERFGTSIGQALRVHSDAMRVRRYQRAEEIANKLPIKLLFPLILFIFPTLLIVLLGPAVISAYRAFMKH
jgi:tight adherence protein C